MTTKTETAPTVAVHLETVNPADLGVLDQARADATPDEELVESVKRHGIMQPPTVAYDPEHGGYVIIMGHRRVGAAIAAGLTEISVLVRESDIDADAIKLEQQIVENERRKALTAAELAQGYKKLELFGKTPAEIAAELGEKPARVKAGLKALTSDTATAALAGGVDLEQAAVIAEFEGDTEAQERLASFALTRPSEFNREATWRRRAREAEARVAELVEELNADGARLIGTYGYDYDHWQGSYEDGWKGILLDRLEMTRDQHATCPGHVAIIVNSGEPAKARIRYGCVDYKHHGHTLPTVAGFTPAEPDEEQADRAAAWEAEREARAKRQQELAANTAARREWLRGFLGNRLRPTAEIFDLIAEASIGLAYQEEVDPFYGPGVAVHLLTGDTTTSGRSGHAELADLVVSGQVTALRALVAHALAVCDVFVEDEDSAPTAPSLVLAYFDHLAAWGYTLTDIDEEIKAAVVNAGGPDLEEADEDDPEDVEVD
ncbi:MAG: parB-like partition protein [Microbacterium sp.]|jgi:ParB family chromosome partitioning protein|nr:parB-like partition protein [Microbacterium sp.]